MNEVFLMRRTTYTLLGVLASLVLIIGPACSDDEGNGGETQQGAESALCSDLEELKTAEQQVANLSTSSSINDITQALNSVKTAFTDLRSSARDARNADITGIQSAVDDFENSLQSAARSGSVSGAISEVQSARAELSAARADAAAKANCGAPSTTP
jgi:hypothetical protein